MTATVTAPADTSGPVETEAGIAEPPAPADPHRHGSSATAAALARHRRPDRLVHHVVITTLAGFTRFWGIGTPLGKQFDEVYYATEAQEMLRYGYENNPGFMFIVHPSVGKWAIALSSAVFGNNETGWRVAPAVAGTLSVLLMVRIARRMFRSNLLGAIAGLLLTMDGVSLVQSRVALLDIFLQFFVLAGFGALVVDRDQFRARLARYLEEGR